MHSAVASTARGSRPLTTRSPGHCVACGRESQASRESRPGHAHSTSRPAPAPKHARSPRLEPTSSRSICRRECSRSRNANTVTATSSSSRATRPRCRFATPASTSRACRSRCTRCPTGCARVIAEMARATRPDGLVVIVDYALPRNRVWRWLVYHAVKLYERDHFADFVHQDLAALLA